MSFSTASGRVARLGDELRPVLELVAVAALATKASFDQPFGHDDVRQRVEHRDVGAGPQLQVVVGLDVRRAHQVDAARIDDDQLGALRAAAASSARRTPDGRRSGWRR